MAISMRIAADQASCRRLVAPARPGRRVLSVRAVAAPEQQAAAGKPAVPAGASARQPPVANPQDARIATIAAPHDAPHTGQWTALPAANPSVRL